MDVFRTPDERFEGLPGYEFEPHYAEVDGLRLHYVDESPKTGGSSASPAEPPRTNPIVCFHGEPTWPTSTGRCSAHWSKAGIG
jgi:haloalkane dehalogenase